MTNFCKKNINKKNDLLEDVKMLQQCSTLLNS